MNQFQQCINLLKKECKEIISYKLKNKENSKLVFLEFQIYLKVNTRFPKM
ncbi:hypothetical protein MASR2M54_05980 [Aliarcobacter cryaerophilus]